MHQRNDLLRRKCWWRMARLLLVCSLARPSRLLVEIQPGLETTYLSSTCWRLEFYYRHRCAKAAERARKKKEHVWHSVAQGLVESLLTQLPCAAYWPNTILPSSKHGIPIAARVKYRRSSDRNVLSLQALRLYLYCQCRIASPAFSCLNEFHIPA
jgi:hypothetical protein